MCSEWKIFIRVHPQTPRVMRQGEAELHTLQYQARWNQATYIKTQFSVSSPLQCRSQAVVCVSTPRMYPRSGYFLVWTIPKRFSKKGTLWQRESIYSWSKNYSFLHFLQEKFIQRSQILKHPVYKSNSNSKAWMNLNFLANSHQRKNVLEWTLNTCTTN